MKRSTPERLRDILDAGAAIERHLPSSRAALEKDELRQAALIRWVSIIGEAANNVDKELRAEHPEVPWPQVIGMRNRIIHSYFTTDIDILWSVASKNVPRLCGQVRSISGSGALFVMGVA